MNNTNFDNIDINSKYRSTSSKEGFFENWTNPVTWGQDVYYRTMEIAGKEIEVGLIVPKGMDINRIDQIFNEKQGEIAKAIYALKFDSKGNIKDKDIGIITLLPNGGIQREKKRKNGISLYRAEEINAKIGTRLFNSSLTSQQHQASKPEQTHQENQHQNGSPYTMKQKRKEPTNWDDIRRVVEVDDDGKEII